MERDVDGLAHLFDGLVGKPIQKVWVAAEPVSNLLLVGRSFSRLTGRFVLSLSFLICTDRSVVCRLSLLAFVEFSTLWL